MGSRSRGGGGCNSSRLDRASLCNRGAVRCKLTLFGQGACPGCRGGGTPNLGPAGRWPGATPEDTRGRVGRRRRRVRCERNSYVRFGGRQAGKLGSRTK